MVLSAGALNGGAGDADGGETVTHTDANGYYLGVAKLQTATV